MATEGYYQSLAKSRSKRINQLRDRLDDLRRELNETTVSLESKTLEASEWRDRNVSLRARIEGREARVRELTNEARRLKRKIEQYEDPPLTVTQSQLKEIVVQFGENRVFPEPLVKTAVEIVTDKSMSETLERLMERKDEIGTPEQMILIGIGMNRQARKHFDNALDGEWSAEMRDYTRGGSRSFLRGREIIVGSGVHGSIVAAMRHRKTGIKPLVLERRDRAGGTFAMTSNPSFYLNSRNRPGPLSIPGDEFGALNVLPGAPIQPSQVSSDEYLGNDAVAWVIRMTLMMHAEVATGINVATLEPYSGSENLLYIGSPGSPGSPGSTSISSVVGRTFIAEGLSSPAMAFPSVAGERYLSFEEFMKRMDSPYPLRGMDRVAVIGAGDGGKTVIEALVGQGPTVNLSIPTLDYPEKIDWFGVAPDRRTKEGWEACNRSRYKGIGRVMGKRVFGFDRPNFLDVGYESIKVNGMPYDYVVDCTGYGENVLNSAAWDEYRDLSGQLLGRQRRQIYYVGPATKLPNERMDEAILAGISDNATSIFRYADRTARLANLVPA